MTKQAEVVDLATRGVLAPDEALASDEAWKEHAIRWESLIGAGVLPKHVKTPGQAVAIARFGQVFGWDPMKSLHVIHVVEGRCELSAAAMMGLILEKARENGDVVSPVEMTAKRAAIQVQRKGLDPAPVVIEFTIGEAGHLVTRANWKTYAADMLWARCVSRVGRRLYPDVIQGAYVEGEIGEHHQPSQANTVEQIVAELDEDDDGPPDYWRGSVTTDSDDSTAPT